jgi:flavin-dependent dehydrogenase
VTYDVIIVGGGPAGSSAAIHLARRGYRILLLERQRFPRPKLCGEFISPEAVAALERLGVLDRVRAAGARVVTRGALIAPTGECVTATFDQLPCTPGYGLGLSRTTLDHVLWKAAQVAGADTRERFHVRALVTSGKGVRGVIGRTSGSDRDVVFTADVVVDASGHARALADEVPAATPSHREGTSARARTSYGPNHRWSVIAFRVHLADVEGLADSVELYFYRTGYGGVIPIEHGLFNLCAMTSWQEVRRARNDPRCLLAATVQQNPAAREKLYKARIEGKVLGLGPLQFGLAPRSGACPAIGDARGELDPFLGQGIRLALESGELAARLIDEAFSRGDIGRLAAHYDACYRAAFRSRFLIARLLRPAAHSPGWGRLLLSVLEGSRRARDFMLRATRCW